MKTMRWIADELHGSLDGEVRLQDGEVVLDDRAANHALEMTNGDAAARELEEQIDELNRTIGTMFSAQPFKVDLPWDEVDLENAFMETVEKHISLVLKTVLRSITPWDSRADYGVDDLVCNLFDDKGITPEALEALVETIEEAKAAAES